MEGLKRLTIPKQKVLDEMEKTNPDNYKEVKQIYELTEMVAAPDFGFEETVVPLSSRQYTVIRSFFARLYMGRLKDAWWRIVDFVEDSHNELTFLELQELTLMLDMLTMVMAPK